VSAPASRCVVFLGGGAVGSYVGGMLAASGVEVALIDGWPAHVEAIRQRGLTIVTPEGEHKLYDDSRAAGDGSSKKGD
jgi:ketopantoate reductase